MSFSAIFISSLLGTSIGILWYSRYLFGKEKTLVKNTNKVKYAFMFLTTLLISLLVGQALLLYKTEPTFLDGIIIGGIIGLGFITPAITTNYLLEEKPLRLLLITTIYHTVSCIVIGATYALLM